MAGTVRIVLGTLFVLGGLLLILTIIALFLGVFTLVIGVVLIASGSSARREMERMATMMPAPSYPLQPPTYPPGSAPPLSGAYPTPPGYPGSPPSSYSPRTGTGSGLPAERFCPVCGAGNTRAAGFCQGCGRPLPPPP